MNVTRRKRLVEILVSFFISTSAIQGLQFTEAVRRRPRAIYGKNAVFLSAQLTPSYSTRGSVSYWWNGGGEGSVHSSVVAPLPQGLAAASFFWAKA